MVDVDARSSVSRASFNTRWFLFGSHKDGTPPIYKTSVFSN